MGTPSANSNSAKPASKQLSNSIMGMRFMQRQNTSKSSVHSKKEDVSNSELDTTVTPSTSLSNDCKSSDIQNNEEAVDNIYPQMATVVDMYGPGSDIIGRRSFGGYRKVVRTTWDNALQKRMKHAGKEISSKRKDRVITDEELLKRYERYLDRGKNKSETASGEDVCASRKRKRKQP